MPAEVSAPGSPQTQQVDKMPPATPKQHGDLQQNSTTFSYAQAAKGKSPSVPSTQTADNVTPEATEINGSRASSSEDRSNIPESDKDMIKRTSSRGRAPHESDLEDGREGQPTPPKDAVNPHKDSMGEVNRCATDNDSKEVSQLDKTAIAGQSHFEPSTPSSPEFGTTSTSTLPKEDDVFSTANGSTDSTSDKQSQTSQNGNRSGEKADAEKNQNSNASWDEEAPTSTPVLKEAAPPPVNIWQIRSQNQAKAKASTSTQPMKSANAFNGSGTSGGLTASNELNTEPKRQDIRKKPKPGLGPNEGTPSSPSSKDSPNAANVANKSGTGTEAPPPPPGAAISGPNPDNAAGDGKKKPQERMEKTDKDVNHTPKPHGREKWVPVPYVPTAVFATPLPTARRGGRGPPRGGREGDNRGRNTATSGNASERQTVAGATNPQTPAPSGHERGRAAVTSTSVNPNTAKSKRASSAGTIHPREQRKVGDSMTMEKRKTSDTVLPKTAVADNFSVAPRRPSAPNIAKDAQSARPPGDGQRNEPSWSSTIVENNNDSEMPPQREYVETAQASGRTRAAMPDRSGEGPARPSDHARDFQGNNSHRERGEPRADRGRGGFRSRGGANHSFFTSNVPNGHGLTNGYQSQHQQPAASPSKPQSNNDRFFPQAQGSSYQLAHHQPRHYRNNSRSQSIPHSAQYGRFSNGPLGGPPHLANLQTDMANEYGHVPPHQGAMSAMPFNSFEGPSVFGMVNLQMNYYFSVENLCKDMYLRSHMDSQGFVFLELLAQFNRIKQLTSDMELIRLACHHSQIIEYVNIDGIDRVRARDGWQQWVRRMEERDPSAQNDGPVLHNIPQYQQTYNHNHTPEDRQLSSLGSDATSNAMDNIQYQALNGAAPAFGQAHNTAEPNNVGTPVTKTPLSAAVSEFSPSARFTSSRKLSASDHHAQGTGIFTDAQVENLRILVRKPVNAAPTISPPFHSPSSRTFSNGSIDGRSIHDELSKFKERQSRPTGSGETSER